jgi:hypothetical protein
VGWRVGYVLVPRFPYRVRTLATEVIEASVESASSCSAAGESEQQGPHLDLGEAGIVVQTMIPAHTHTSQRLAKKKREGATYQKSKKHGFRAKKPVLVCVVRRTARALDVR